MRALLLPAVLTILIETVFFFIVGYRKKYFVIVCVLINFVTNVILNTVLSLFPFYIAKFLILPLELTVVAVEWGVLGFFVENKKRLLLFVFLSNLLSFTIGLFL